MKPASRKFGVGPDAYEYMLSLNPALLWVPQVGNPNGVDLSDNRLTPTAQNTGDLTISTGPCPPRIIGGAPVCEFGGTNGYIDFGDEPALEMTSALTISALFHAQEDLCGIITKGTPLSIPSYRAWDLGLNSTNLFLTATNGSSYLFVVTVPYPPLDEWHYIVATWDGTTTENGVSLYIDGVLQSQATATGSIATMDTRGDVLIGGGMSGSTNVYFQGSIGLVSVHDCYMTEGEIKAATELILRGA